MQPHFRGKNCPEQNWIHRNKGSQNSTANEHRLLLEIQAFSFPFIETFDIFIRVFAGIGLSTLQKFGYSLVKAAGMHEQPKIELLQAEVDENDQSFFRLLIDGRDIKYVTVEPGLYTTEDMCFGPSLVSLLPDLPSGDWNDGVVARNAINGQPHFERVSRTAFPGISHQWHGTYVDYLDVTVGRKLRTGIYEVTCPQFDTLVVAKFARFEWEIGYLENETIPYEWIDGHEVGPRFLGHLTEDGRVIGFLMERVTGARHANPDDLAVCQKSLRQLHELKIHHGDTNRFNFHVCDTKAVLIDFDSARKCDDENLLIQEMEDLPRRLQIHQEKEAVGFYAKSFMMFFVARVGIHLHLEDRLLRFSLIQTWIVSMAFGPQTDKIPLSDEQDGLCDF